MESIVKRQLIETSAQDGKCHVRLLAALKAFKTCSAANLERALIKTITELGRFPTCGQVIGNLCLVNLLMQGKQTNEILNMSDSEQQMASLDVMNELLESQTRFGFEDSSQCIHISYYNSKADHDDATFNEDGYSSMFVVTQLMFFHKRIGAASVINFDELFAQNFPKVQSPVQKFEQSQPEEDYAAQEEIDFADHVTDLNLENLKLRQQIDSMRMEIQTKIHSKAGTPNKRELANKIQQMSKVYAESLSPNDASSVIERYDKRYMEQGTVLNPDRSDEQSVLTIGPNSRSIQQVSNIQPLRMSKQVVVGYKKTHDMIQEETKINQSIQPINGLADPLKNNRLNFLIHFNSSVEEMKLEEPTMTIFKMFNLINDYKSETPSQELVYQMITKTFDMKRGVVIANPFQLPFIQVGMHISEASLKKTFDMMQYEFKTLWFQEFKNIRIPSFHSEYAELTDLRLVRKSKSKNQKDDTRGKVSSRGEWRRNRSEGLSILGIR